MPVRDTGMKGRIVIWGALTAVLILVVYSGMTALRRGPILSTATDLSVPGDYGEIPDFTLIDRSGRTVTRDDLTGRFWVADFIFTRCTGVCPILTARMAALGKALALTPGGQEVRLVSFSVDPSWDTPAVLQRHAKETAGNIPPERWLFLTGAPEEVHRLVRDGFHLSVAERAPETGVALNGSTELITHSDRFVLVDPAGKIRGYYHGTEEESIAKLTEDLKRMIREKQQ